LCTYGGTVLAKLENKIYSEDEFIEFARATPNLVAVPFSHMTIYVGADNGKFVVRFMAPETGRKFILGDLNNPDIDIIGVAMKVLKHCAQIDELLGEMVHWSDA